jgi:septum formation protein
LRDTPQPVVLASRSPQRRAILEQLGVAFVAEPADVDELAEGDPGTVAAQNAAAKARAVARAGATVLGVDTLVALDGAIFGKPRDEAHARATLRTLAGRTHEVHSGVAVADGLAEPRVQVAVTGVTFRPLSDAWIDWYVALGEWEGRAGGYAIQGAGAALVTSVQGDYANVVGLPVALLLGMVPGLLVG